MNQSRRRGFQGFLRPTMLVLLLSILPLLFQPNLGGTILVTLICLMMHVENRGWRYPLLGGALMVALFASLVMIEPYRMRRFLAFWDPWSDPMNKGFQIIQGLVAFCNGRVFGVRDRQGAPGGRVPARGTDGLHLPGDRRGVRACGHPVPPVPLRGVDDSRVPDLPALSQFVSFRPDPGVDDVDHR